MVVDIDIQEDMDTTIKSEPGNYTSCSVKSEHLTSGFLTILENIKIDTNTQEDVVKHIKSEMDDFKPCCVKLERISDSFLTTGKHTQKHNGELNCFSPPVEAKVRGKNLDHKETKSWKKCKEEGCSKWPLGGDGLRGEVSVLNMWRCSQRGHVEKKGAMVLYGGEVSVLNMEEQGMSVKKKGVLDFPREEFTCLTVNTITTLVRRSCTKTELSQEVNRKVAPTKRVDRIRGCSAHSPLPSKRFWYFWRRHDDGSTSPLLHHIHSHSDDLDRDLTAQRESPLDVDQGPPRAGTFPRLTDEKHPTDKLVVNHIRRDVVIKLRLEGVIQECSEATSGGKMT
uniref:Uncharacterized protein n=1 Tax=Timema douglasi TaxID=61478 RepID=A0A7R8Z6Q0_TIMDO|nr:unnamed protein product [Timema douglasi]